MGLNETASAERVHISFFGMRNAGKSSLVNAVTGQELSVVSDVKGTTTDPVKKAMELLPIGPVVIVDTPGIDDEGELGALRIKKAKQAMSYTDIAILVVDAKCGLSPLDNDLLNIFKEKNIPYIIAYNKADLLKTTPPISENEIFVSAKDKINIEKLKEMLGKVLKTENAEKKLVSDLINPGDLVLMVIPIDEAAPKGRIILPQQQTLRDILDTGASAMVCKDSELEKTLAMLSQKPKLVITDSQVFGAVSKIVPKDILLTSFSILFARYKGDLKSLVLGAKKLDEIGDGDKILISEGCTHHRQCGDIGTQKLPMWIQKYTGKKPQFSFSSGTDFPEDISEYSLIIHCGGCMLNSREMKSRIAYAKDEDIPMTNYGVIIAKMNGILERSIEPFEDIYNLLIQ